MGKRQHSQRIRGGADDSFKVLTYNILDYNLASNAVPRTMDKTNFTSIESTPDGKNTIKTLNDTYGKFHNNSTTGNTPAITKNDKNFKRQLWGENIETNDALDTFKGRYGEVDLTHITFVEPNTFSLFGGAGIKNLKGILDSKGVDSTIYSAIKSYNDSVNDWDIRGFKISKLIKESNADIVFLQEYGSCHDKQFTDTDTNTKQTLPESLSEYKFIFFLNPKFKVAPSGEKDGVIIYYKPTVFNIQLATEGAAAETDSLVIDTTSDTSKYRLLACFDNEVDYRNNSANAKPLPVSDRRSAGFVKLTHIPSNKSVLCINAHLMTDSKDKNGKVKMAEVKLINDKIAEYTGGNLTETDGIVFAGDFNTIYKNGYNDRGIFGAGFTGSFSNGLTDVFVTTGKERSVSSVNNTRSDWIDYIFSKNLTIETLDYEELTTGGTVTYIPDATHPSDHIPISCTFKFSGSTTGGRRKRLTKRRKGLRKRRTIRT